VNPDKDGSWSVSVICLVTVVFVSIYSTGLL